MHEVTVQCPYCFELVSLEIEPDEKGSMVQDCDVCCRPWQVWVGRDDDGEPQVSVQRS